MLTLYIYAHRLIPYDKKSMSQIEKKPTAGIILAAGMSTRIGQTKQLLKVKNRSLIEWVLDAALDSMLDSIIIVLGHNARQIKKTIGKKKSNTRLSVILNPNYRDGLSSSVQAGLLKARKSHSCMFLLGDQPMINTHTINHLLVSFWNSEKEICAPTYKGKRKNPTIFAHSFYDRILKTQGDIGARDIIKAHPENTLYVELNSRLCFIDIDTEDDLDVLESLV